MGFIFGLIKRLLKFAVYLVLVITIVTLIPNLPPYAKYSSIELAPTQPRVGPLKPNEALNNAQKLYKEKLAGPEAFALYDGEVYTTLESGEIVKLSPGGSVTFVAKMGEPCHKHQVAKCGRPLGLTIDEKGLLFVADAYYGIWKVDLKTHKQQLLVSPRVEIDGRKPKLFNSVAVVKNGDLYWTESSSDFYLHEGIQTMLADPSGRLFHYNAATNRSKVLLDDLWFANGVAVSPDNQFVVVAESSRYRLTKYYIDGPKKGKSEVFLNGLPGVPDNLRALPDGSGLSVGLYTVFDEESPLLVRSLAGTPGVRKFLARMLALAKMPFEFLSAQVHNPVIEDIALNMGSFKSVSAFVPSTSGLIVIDWNGKILESYYSTDGGLGHISDAIVYQDKLLTGSPHSQDFVGAVAAPPLLKKAYASAKHTPPPKTAETVTKPIPKPTEAPKPKVEQKKEAPKVTKPVAQEPKTQPPKTATQPPKAAETVKTTPPPPKEKKTETVKPAPTKPMPKVESTTAKPAASPAKPPAKQPEPKPNTPPPKPEIKVEKVEKQAAKPAPEKKPSSDNKQKVKSEKAVPEEIPIIEEIPSDTMKPTKEKLKVIKKGGPTEIPNPAL